MNQRQLEFGRIQEAFLMDFPELREAIENEFKLDFDFEREMPGAYLVFEDVVKKLVFKLLDTDENQILLARLFRFFEEMANASDPNVSRDLLGIAILEPLVARGESVCRAWKYMGPTMKEMARAEAVSQGRPDSVSPDS